MARCCQTELGPVGGWTDLGGREPGWRGRAEDSTRRRAATPAAGALSHRTAGKARDRAKGAKERERGRKKETGKKKIGGHCTVCGCASGFTFSQWPSSVVSSFRHRAARRTPPDAAAPCALHLLVAPPRLARACLNYPPGRPISDRTRSFCDDNQTPVLSISRSQAADDGTQRRRPARCSPCLPRLFATTEHDNAGVIHVEESRKLAHAANLALGQLNGVTPKWLLTRETQPATPTAIL